LPQLELVDLRANYGDVAVLERISFSVDKGEIISLIGPSGSGKSTLLRVLVGLLPPAAGSVRLDGREVDYHSKAAVRGLRSRMAIVFQQFNLFQNMSVLANVTIAPVRVKGQPPAEAEAYAKKLLDRVGLGHKLHAYPDQLSGGQQQRVAIARALALKPEIVLLDEVTSALDPELVNEVLDVIRLLAADGMTIFFVSHEMAFVREVSSKVIFMADGSVVESGTPAQIFDAPQQPRTREFVSKILRH
jgi:polar amino acid transport system ATP-binding protein